MFRIGTAILATILAETAAAGAYAQDGGTKPILWPKCAEFPKIVGCWEEFSNRPGCHTWLNHFRPGKETTWSGACSGGVAVGRGVLGYTGLRKSNDGTGSLVRGKKHGPWVFRYTNGNVFEGPYDDGVAHGRWVYRFARGAVREVNFVRGRPVGRWVHRFAGGGRLEGSFRIGTDKGGAAVLVTPDGKRHPGKWIDNCFRDASGKAWLSSGSKALAQCRSE